MKLILFSTAKWPWGAVATASFLICVVSGVVLAVPYDVSIPYLSVSEFVLISSAAAFFRNSHYWSAQLFLVFTLAHLYFQVWSETKIHMKAHIWFRLTFSIAVTIFTMLSGFILKGDADSQQAYRIFDALLRSVPFIGESISRVLLGKENDLQLIYIHHVATATLFLAVVIIEHARTIWPKFSLFFYTLICVILLSFFLHAPLHNGFNPVMKGPWYFVGLQEALHWLSNPWPALVLPLMVLIGIAGIRYFKPIILVIHRWWLGGLLLIYGVLTLIGFFFRGPDWQWIWPWENKLVRHISLPVFDPLWSVLKETEIYGEFSEVFGRKESCLVCHSSISGFSPSHSPAAIGCSSCHLGNPFVMGKEAAHRNMVLIPGNLDRVALTCGASGCHAEISRRIQTNIMTTLSGMISVDRWVFGEATSPSQLTNVSMLGHDSPADEHLRNLCVGCHLGAEKVRAGEALPLEKGGGCNACHLQYSQEGLREMNQYVNNKENKLLKIHPSLTIKVSDDKCFSCHNRSGRISTSYEGWFETLDDTILLKQQGRSFRVVDQNRIFSSAMEDVHHKAGLSCIDCHTSYELMGDGTLYAHKELQVKIQCIDCHGASSGLSTRDEAIDAESERIITLNKFLFADRKHLKQAKGGRIYVNVFDSSGTHVLIGKNTGVHYPIKPLSASCTKGKAHKRLTCQACHTAWAPTCLGCHNTYNQDANGYDHVLNKRKRGTWTEAAGIFGQRAPTLGVATNEEGIDVVKPFVPGMVLTTDGENYQPGLRFFKRLFAPADPHTTSAKGRSCKECHLSGIIMGFGEGRLQIDNSLESPVWIFEPDYALNVNDHLPEDAWTGFLVTMKGAVSTRPGHRPFNEQEQKRILLVASCLGCHTDNSKVMTESLVDFDKVIKRRHPECKVPFLMTPK